MGNGPDILRDYVAPTVQQGMGFRPQDKKDRGAGRCPKSNVPGFFDTVGPGYRVASTSSQA